MNTYFDINYRQETIPDEANRATGADAALKYLERCKSFQFSPKKLVLLLVAAAVIITALLII